MTTSVNMKDIKRRVWSIYFQDGLFEACVGFALILWGVIMFHPRLMSLSGLPIVVVLALQGLKKRYVAPRVGYVSPSSKGNKSSLMAGILLLFALGILVFGLSLSLARGGEIGGWSWLLGGLRWGFDCLPIVIGLILAGVLGFFGLRARATRFYAFALLFALAGVLFYLLPLSPEDRSKLLLMSCGFVLLVAGVVRFIQFLRNNPVLPEASADERT